MNQHVDPNKDLLFKMIKMLNQIRQGCHDTNGKPLAPDAIRGIDIYVKELSKGLIK